MMMLYMWRIGIDKKGKKNWGVFYRCEEHAWMLYVFWERTYISHICEILVSNPWHIGTNTSRAVKNWYQLFTMWNLRSVKFTVQHSPAIPRPQGGRGFKWLVHNLSVYLSSPRLQTLWPHYHCAQRQVGTWWNRPLVKTVSKTIQPQSLRAHVKIDPLSISTILGSEIIELFFMFISAEVWNFNFS